MASNALNAGIVIPAGTPIQGQTPGTYGTKSLGIKSAANPNGSNIQYGFRNGKAIPQGAGTITPTVVSSQNVRSDIPGMNAQLQTYTQGQTIPQTDQTTGGTNPTAYDTPTNDYESLYNNALADQNNQPGDPVFDQQMSLLDQISKSGDAVTTASINAIKTQANARKAQLQQSQQSNMAATNQALLRGGTSRYDPAGASSVLSTQSSADILSLSALDAQEQSSIAQAQEAQQNQDYQTLEQKLSLISDQRKQKQDLAAKIADNESAAMTDNAKQINDILLQASQNGASKDVIAAISASTSPEQAIQAASSYLTDPTTPGGQYAAYVRQAQALGQTPISAGDFIAKQKYNEAYNAAAGSAAGAASVTGTNGGNIDLTSLTPTAQATLKSNGFTSFNSGVQDLAIQLVTGQLAPSELSKRTTGTSSYSDVLTAANKYSQATTGQTFDIAQADRDYKFATNPQTQNTLNYLGSLVGSDDGSGNFTGGNLNQLIAQSNERVGGVGIGGTADVGSAGQSIVSQFPPLNNVTQWTKLESGNPEIAAYHATLLETADQVAKILQGGGTGGGTSDSKLSQAQSLFDAGFTPEQMSAVATSLQGLLSNRAASMIKDNPYLSDYATQFGIQTDNGITTTTQQILQDETMATGKISAFYNSSPANAAIVDALHQQFPDLSASEIAQNLGL